jgi:Tfp pilus assembly protein PilV
MKASFKKVSARGLTLVEVVIAASIILVAVVALLSVHNLYLRVAFSNANAVKAAYLAEEGIEVVRWLRDDSWDENIATLSLNTDYGLVFSNGTWGTTTSNLYVENFLRTIQVSAVSRDGSGDIVSSGGSADPNTLLVTSTVSWATSSGTTTKSVATYLTDLYEN